MRLQDVVWVLVMYDLPSVTTEEKRALLKYRNRLFRLGFQRLQWSVYARPYPKQEAAAVDLEQAMRGVPPGGRVRAITVTDLQFERMRVMDGGGEPKHRREPERSFGQLVLL